MRENQIRANNKGIHIIVDFLYLYYKYKFTIESGRIKRLTSEDESGEIKDVSYIYYPLKEIEGFRKDIEDSGQKVSLSICFDSPSIKKEIDSTYKESRINKLGPTDRDNINMIEDILKSNNYNVYKIDGMEADDIIASLIDKYSEQFDFNIVCTPDTDLLALIKPGVGINRYKVKRGYQKIGMSNFEEYCSEEFKCNIKYNNIMLYKVLCGDKSDNIKGIKGFGAKAFDKFTKHIEGRVDWKYLNNAEYINQVLKENKEYIGGEEAIEQALNCLKNVKFVSLEEIGKIRGTEDSSDKLLKTPIAGHSKVLREEVYGSLDMLSLI